MIEFPQKPITNYQINKIDIKKTGYHYSDNQKAPKDSIKNNMRLIFNAIGKEYRKIKHQCQYKKIQVKCIGYTHIVQLI